MVCRFEFGFLCVGLKFGVVLLWNLMLAIAVRCVSAPSRGLWLGCYKAEILVGCYLRRVSLVWVFLALVVLVFWICFLSA